MFWPPAWWAFRLYWWPLAECSNASMYLVLISTNVFVPVSLLYSAGNKTYYYIRQFAWSRERETLKSSCKTITRGVPQGSMLGPLIFLSYINDLANVSDVIFSLVFADDSNMLLSGTNPDDLIKLTNTGITKIINLLRINKLSLNLKQTHLMVFRKNRRKIKLKEDVIIYNVKIDFVTKTKFLGVMRDQHLTFESNVQYTKGNVARGIGILYKAR